MHSVHGNGSYVPRFLLTRAESLPDAKSFFTSSNFPMRFVKAVVTFESRAEGLVVS